MTHAAFALNPQRTRTVARTARAVKRARLEVSEAQLRHELLVLRVPLPLDPRQPLRPPVPPAPAATPVSRAPLRAASAGRAELQSRPALAADEIAALEAVVHLLQGWIDQNQCSPLGRPPQSPLIGLQLVFATNDE